MTLDKAIRWRQDFDYACVSNQRRCVPAKIEYVIPDYVDKMPGNEWRTLLIKRKLYTEENVPKKKTKQIKDILLQEFTAEPTPELEKNIENARKLITIVT